MTNLSSKNELILELITEYINPGLQMHSGSVEVVSYHLDESPPLLKLSFKGMCGDCPSSFAQTLKSVANFLKEEADIENLMVENVNEKPEKFNLKYVLEEDEEL